MFLHNNFSLIVIFKIIDFLFSINLYDPSNFFGSFTLFNHHSERPSNGCFLEFDAVKIAEETVATHAEHQGRVIYVPRCFIHDQSDLFAKHEW